MQALNGRPRGRDDAQRARELLQLMVQGGLDLEQAAKRARIKGETVLRLLANDHFFEAYSVIRAGGAVVREAA